MCARAYSMEKRRGSTAATRQCILEAARRLLAESTGTDLGLDAIARSAGVSRLTIYNHFGSRSGLLEALYDNLATRGKVRRGKEALRQQDPDVALVGFIRALVEFWSSDPVVIRRLHAMAALDPEIAKGLAAREARRQRAAAEIVRRMAPTDRQVRGLWKHRFVADTLCTLASFETYDALARARHGQEEIITVVIHLARSVMRHSNRRDASS
jgi:AcrR family transcriptional regulator